MNIEVTFLPSEYETKGLVFGHPETVEVIKQAVDRLTRQLSDKEAEVAELRKRLTDHDNHWLAVAAALGGISCGGVDVPVDDPHGNAQCIITKATECQHADDCELDHCARGPNPRCHGYTTAFQQGAEAAREAAATIASLRVQQAEQEDDECGADAAGDVADAIRSMPLPTRGEG